MKPSADKKLGLITQVESALSLLNLRAVCEHGTSTDRPFRFEALVFGSDDFLVSIGGLALSQGGITKIELLLTLSINFHAERWPTEREISTMGYLITEEFFELKFKKLKKQAEQKPASLPLVVTFHYLWY